MPTLRFRIRTLMVAVSLIAIVVWGVMMGSRSYDYYQRAQGYASQERGWRQIAANKQVGMERFHNDCAEYFAQLTAKYRRAMWQPWRPVAPDPPPTPGVLEALEQLRN